MIRLLNFWRACCCHFYSFSVRFLNMCMPRTIFYLVQWAHQPGLWLYGSGPIAWKVSKYGVFSGSYFPVFGLNIQSEYGKIRTRKDSVFGHFSNSGQLAYWADRDGTSEMVRFHVIKNVLVNKIYDFPGRPTYRATLSI